MADLRTLQESEVLKLERESDGPPTDRIPVALVEVSSTPRSPNLSSPSTDVVRRSTQDRLPQVGEMFLGYELEAVLGEGAFGRVFLARQGKLAQRHVALKITSGIPHEPQTLAQLQHTNIVPIYSVEDSDGLQVICMPYFGGITFEHLLSDLRTHPSLPESGREIINSLQNHSSSAHKVKSSQVVPVAVEPAKAPSSITITPPVAPAFPGSTLALKALGHATFVEAVLWLGARLADGLAHAHEHGIVHCDLKPANILLTEDGQPMLLDFNLASNREQSSEIGTQGGGTVPYMAPEQIRAFRHEKGAQVDGRSDIYSLGLVFYELLTGRSAFPIRKGLTNKVLEQMLADRRVGPPQLWPFNEQITPAVEAMIRRCLEPDPAVRYQSAREFEEDVTRHLAHLPLQHTREPSWRERARKWARRHPYLASTTAVTLLAAILLLGMGWYAWHWKVETETTRAYAQWQEFLADTDQFMPGLVHPPDTGLTSPPRHREFLQQAMQTADRYRVASDPAWLDRTDVSRLAPVDQDRLRERMGEYLLLLAQALADQYPEDRDLMRTALMYNDRAAACYGPTSKPRWWYHQRQRLLRALGEQDAARQVLAESTSALPQTAQEHYLHGLELYREGQYPDALKVLQQAVSLDPQHFRGHFLMGNCHYRLQDYVKAAGCYSVCISLNPRHAKARFNHGKVLVLARHYGPAFAEFSRALELDPQSIETRIERALTAAQLGRLREAEEDLTAVLQSPDAPTFVWFRRATIRERLKNAAGASEDRAEGMRREPTDEISWVTRGLQRVKSDPKAALADFRKAEELNPRSFFALQNQAHVLAEHLKQDREALAVLNRLVNLYPQSQQARAGRAVLLARAKRVDEALADVETCLKDNPLPMTRYQLAGVFALTLDHSGHAEVALQLLSEALADGAGWAELPTDPDLLPLHGNKQFQQLLAAAVALKAAKHVRPR